MLKLITWSFLSATFTLGLYLLLTMTAQPDEALKAAETGLLVIAVIAALLGNWLAREITELVVMSLMATVLAVGAATCFLRDGLVVMAVLIVILTLSSATFVATAPAFGVKRVLAAVPPLAANGAVFLGILWAAPVTAALGLLGILGAMALLYGFRPGWFESTPALESKE